MLSDPLHSRVYQRSQNPRFRGHWSGFNLGFADFSVSNEQLDGAGDYLDLERKNSLVMQFNMFQYSMRLNKLNNIGLVTGLGLEYQRFRFANKIASNEVTADKSTRWKLKTSKRVLSRTFT